MIADKMDLMDFPKLKKKVNGFLLNEEGKISRQAAVSVGGTLGVLALGSLASQSAFAFNLCDSQMTHSSNINWVDPADCSASPCYVHTNAIDTEFNDGVLKSQHQHHYNSC